ncbi:hypothetical protein [Candidatus Nanohalococcus occultus]|uniref:Uncharacterized protein n=1 Tax=Candidatus Nanohalococcus occultus TaxID=2978047 RepID=A0ABY8CDZ7_9ARCH|nr:hypothetical protein SVXNc_0418 [Candidatus Nanohaloarchaeota archaeon SVXNc]
MKLTKTAVLLCLVLLTVGLVAGYAGSGSGSGEPTTACNDGSDNDGDGLVDGEDPGCSNPLYEDDSEFNLYDMDASWIFAGETDPNESSSTVFFGSEVVDRGIGSSPFEDSIQGAGNRLNETYVSQSHVEYGGGTLDWMLYDNSDYEATDSVTGRGELIDSPRKDQCGNSKVDGDDDTLNCPEDAGLPDDRGNSDANTVSEVLDTHSITNGDGTTHEDPVTYVMDLNAKEFTTEGFPAGFRTEDISSSTSDDTKTYSDMPWTDVPDFYVDTDTQELWIVYPEVTDSAVIGSVTDKRAPHDDTYWDYSGDGTDYAGSCSGANCSEDEVELGDHECDSRSPAHVDDQQLDKDTTDTIRATSTEHETSKSGDNGYTEDTSDQDIRIQVTNDDEGGYNELDYEKGSSCGGSVPDDTCTGSGCSVSGGGEYYSGTEKNYAADYESATTEYRYETIELKTAKILDLNPDTNPGSQLEPKEVLFSGDNFKGGAESYSSNVLSQGFNDKGYFSWEVSSDTNNDIGVSLSRFTLDVDSSNEFISVRDWFRSFDADGPNGQGDGFLGVEDGRILGTTTATLASDTRNSSDGSSSSFGNFDFVNPSGVENNNDLSCPEDHVKCVIDMDMSLENIDQWDSPTPDSADVSYELQKEELDESLGVYKLFQNITPDTATGTYDGTVSNPTPGVCGDQPNEYWTYMEGPEVNNDVLNNNKNAQQVCVDSRTDCVVKGEEVSEGTVVDVSSQQTSGFEKSIDSPDREVCLAIPDSGDTHPGDNYDYDDDGTVEEMGGEWYDMDNEVANQYLRNGGSDLVDLSREYDSNGDGTYNSSDIDYYYTENPSAYHATYNPAGGEEGIALEDDCGPNIDGCDDSGTNTAGKSPLFFSTFTEGEKDEDFHPLSQTTEQDPAAFNGTFNRIDDDSNQLERSMDTVVSFTNPNWKTTFYERSISNSSVDQYGITKNLSMLISTRGEAYAPGRTYHRNGASRTSTDATSHSKTERVFGNSFADVSTHSDGRIQPGDGVWIDPDYIKQGWENGEYQSMEYFSGWRDKLGFNIDLTGPDAGLGFDTGPSSSYEHLSTGNVDTDIVIGDIYFEGEEDGVDNDGNGGVDESEVYEGTNIVGETTPRLEPPMCGDDRKEFLIEEMGESVNPERYDGGYACADAIDSCVDMSSTPRIIEAGDYRNTDEPDESAGRAKEDKEICSQTTVRGPTDPKYRWMDQDLTEEYCRANSFYGSQGVRWFDEDYVNNYPEAVKYGIDDDWNVYMEDEGKSTEPSPVDNGNRTHNKIRTTGFCGGDDAGEFFVTQQCNTDLCETDTDVQGVVKTPGACILDGSKYPAVSSDIRDTYQPGEAVRYDYGGEVEEIRCLQGTWYDNWPIVAEQDQTDITLGSTKAILFHVINPTENAITFDLQIEDTTMRKFSEFSQTGENTMSLNVPAQSTRTVEVDSIGGKDTISGVPVWVQATSTYSDLTGEAYTNVNVVPQQTSGQTQQDPNDVPGIGIVQVLAAALTATAAVFFS